jgi:K+-sensing histidine kinase KdpD
VTAPRQDRSDDVVGYAIGGLAPIAVASALTLLRDEVDNANLALILVLVVVLAGIAGGRGPALVAAVVATLSYDFFLTRPYLSLTIDSADDVETTIILLAIGLIVGQVSVVARRRRSAAERGSDEVIRIHRVAERLVAGAPVPELTEDVCREIAGLLRLRSCRFDRQPAGESVPRLERTGAITGIRTWHLAEDAFALPADGVALLVLARGKEVGHLLLEPEPSEKRGVSLEERMVAVALSDQLGAGIMSSAADEPATD